MPSYEYRCRTCAEQFEVSRPMNAPVDETRCPAGHADAVRVFTVMATGRAGAPAPTGGGCCGGACGCG